jgi:hypothetical protein
VRIVTARIMLASMINTAPPNSSINVSLRRSVAVTPHNNYLTLAKLKLVNYTSKSSYRERDRQQIQISDDVQNKGDQYISRRDSRLA